MEDHPRASTRRPTASCGSGYAAARDGFTRRRGAHFATLDAQRKQAQSRKEELVAEAEKLADSTDWAATANRLKDLMTEWKAAPRASKEAEQKLWERFRAAQDAFFTRRSEVFSRPRRRAAGATWSASRRCSPRPRRWTSTPTRRAPRPSCATSRPQWHEAGRVPREAAAGPGPPAARRSTTRSATAMDSAWRRTTTGGQPAARPDAEQVAEAEERLARAQAAGDDRRIKEAEQALASKRQFLELAEHTG